MPSSPAPAPARAVPDDAGKDPSGEQAGSPASITNAALERFRNAKIIGARLISTRSLSLKIAFEGGERVAFKPMLRYDRRARFEVAAYRIAESLEIDGVPPSTIRLASQNRLVNLLKKSAPDKAAALAKKGMIDNRGRIPGAAITWLKGLDRSGLDPIGGKTTLLKWLDIKTDSIPDPPLAAQASAMVVLDYLIGNWDRFSGGNLFINHRKNTFVLLDNNGSFAPWSDRQRNRMNGLLAATKRFSSALVTRLRELDRPAIERALSREPWHATPLLDEQEIGGVLERRDRLIDHVDRLVSAHGAESVLAFK